MGRHFTEEENRAYYASQPKKHISVMVVYHDPAGRILIVKPGYKPGWNLIGGLNDEHESPLATAVRETKEEIGLDINPGRLALLGVQYLVPGTDIDAIRILFTASLTDAEIGAIVVPRDEIEDHRFVSATELANLTEHTKTDATQGVCAILTSPHQIGYLEGTQLKGGLA